MVKLFSNAKVAFFFQISKSVFLIKKHSATRNLLFFGDLSVHVIFLYTKGSCKIIKSYISER